MLFPVRQTVSTRLKYRRIVWCMIDIVSTVSIIGGMSQCRRCVHGLTGVMTQQILIRVVKFSFDLFSIIIRYYYILKIGYSLKN